MRVPPWTSCRLASSQGGAGAVVAESLTSAVTSPIGTSKTGQDPIAGHLEPGRCRRPTAPSTTAACTQQRSMQRCFRRIRTLPPDMGLRILFSSAQFPWNAFVMDIAAGNRHRGSGWCGAKPTWYSSRHLRTTSHAAGTRCGEELVRRLGADAGGHSVHFPTSQGDRPCVVNLSLGTNGGPHDGVRWSSRGIDAMVGEKAQPCGRDRRQQLTGATASTPRVRLPRLASSGDLVGGSRTRSGEAEVWFPGASWSSMIGPDGTVVLDALQPGSTAEIADEQGKARSLRQQPTPEPNNGDNVLRASIWRGLPDWRLDDPAALAGRRFCRHAWVERLDSAQSSFGQPVPTHP